MKKLFCIGLTFLCLSGCTFPYHLFVKNYSSEQISLSFKLAPHIKLASHEISLWDSIPDRIKQRHFKDFKEQQYAETDSDSVFHYVIPAKTTAYLNAGLRNVREVKLNGQLLDSLGLEFWSNGFPPKISVNWFGDDKPDEVSATHKE